MLPSTVQADEYFAELVQMGCAESFIHGSLIDSVRRGSKSSCCQQALWAVARRVRNDRVSATETLASRT